MVWLGMGIVWAGYTWGLYGYCLIRGYNITLHQVVSPTQWYSGKWPPQPAGNQDILPTGTEGGTANIQLTVANAPAGTASSTSGGVVPGQSTRVASAAAIRTAATGFGWGNGGQWNALTHLINQESGGNPTIRNPSSGALGIAQALGHGTSCSAGSLGNEYGPQYGLTCQQASAANSGNAIQQARWMMGYIRSRYGSPAKAWQHEIENNWY